MTTRTNLWVASSPSLPSSFRSCCCRRNFSQQRHQSLLVASVSCRQYDPRVVAGSTIGGNYGSGTTALANGSRRQRRSSSSSLPPHQEIYIKNKRTASLSCSVLPLVDTSAPRNDSGGVVVGGSRRRRQCYHSNSTRKSQQPRPPLPPRQGEVREREGTPNNQRQQQRSHEERSYSEHWMKQMKSIPNIITMSRVASSPLLCYLIVNGQHEAALVGCVLAGVSDVLDGYLARHHNMATVLGTYLDPLADKILINVLSVSLWYTEMLPTPLVGLWLFKDVTLMTATYMYVANNTEKGMDVTDPLTVPLKVNPTTTSKINTALQFATLSTAIVCPLYSPVNDLLTGLCWVTGGTTIASAFSYVGYSAFTESGNIIPSSSTRKATSASAAPKK